MFDPIQFKKAVQQTARYAASKFPSHVDADDIEQSLWLWCYAKKDWLQSTIEELDEEEAGKKIRSLMRRVAFDSCNTEKAAVEGFDPSDVYRYSQEKIVKLLPDIFDYEDWQSFGAHGDGQPTGKRQANTSGDRIAELIDIKSELEMLKEDSQIILTLQYKFNCSMAEIADEFGISVEAAKKRAQRSLAALQRNLGYKDPEEVARRSERRTVRPNSAWRASQEF